MDPRKSKRPRHERQWSRQARGNLKVLVLSCFAKTWQCRSTKSTKESKNLPNTLCSAEGAPADVSVVTQEIPNLKRQQIEFSFLSLGCAVFLTNPRFQAEIKKCGEAAWNKCVWSAALLMRHGFIRRKYTESSERKPKICARNNTCCAIAGTKSFHFVTCTWQIKHLCFTQQIMHQLTASKLLISSVYMKSSDFCLRTTCYTQDP